MTSRYTQHVHTGPTTTGETAMRTNRTFDTGGSPGGWGMSTGVSTGEQEACPTREDPAPTGGALHFIGFRGDAMRFNNALLVFGPPDFVHYLWDVRARQEVVPGDIAIFARGTERDSPTEYAWDDSAHQ